jgi:hypothetical protein
MGKVLGITLTSTDAAIHSANATPQGGRIVVHNYSVFSAMVTQTGADHIRLPSA